MNVRAGRPSGSAHLRDRLPLTDDVPFFDEVGAVVADRVSSVAVVDDHRPASPWIVPEKTTLPGRDATIGVPLGAGISTPSCRRPPRIP